MLKDTVEELSKSDIYSMMLFCLFKLRDCPEQSTLSELIYLLDEKSLLKLCEYYGGMTIKIPTVKELEWLILALQLYYDVDINGKDFDDTKQSLNQKAKDTHSIIKVYNDIKPILNKFDFKPRYDKF